MTLMDMIRILLLIIIEVIIITTISSSSSSIVRNYDGSHLGAQTLNFSKMICDNDLFFYFFIFATIKFSCIITCNNECTFKCVCVCMDTCYSLSTQTKSDKVRHAMYLIQTFLMWLLNSHEVPTKWITSQSVFCFMLWEQKSSAAWANFQVWNWLKPNSQTCYLSFIDKVWSQIRQL